MYHIIYVVFLQILGLCVKGTKIVIQCKSQENTYMTLYVYNKIGDHTEKQPLANKCGIFLCAKNGRYSSGVFQRWKNSLASRKLWSGAKSGVF